MESTATELVVALPISDCVYISVFHVTGGSVPPEQVVSNGQVVFNSGTLTLPPVSLSDVMSLSPSSETDPEVSSGCPLLLHACDVTVDIVTSLATDTWTQMWSTPGCRRGTVMSSWLSSNALSKSLIGGGLYAAKSNTVTSKTWAERDS